MRTVYVLEKIEKEQIPHCQNSSKIPHCQNSSKIPHCQNSSKIPHCQNSSKIPHCQNSSKIPHCLNSSKIPHCQNSSKITVLTVWYFRTVQIEWNFLFFILCLKIQIHLVLCYNNRNCKQMTVFSGKEVNGKLQ
jgi:hypothetical protein